MGSMINENFRKFQQDYRYRDAIKKDRTFLKLERNLIRINPERNYFSPTNNLNLPELSKGDYKSFLSGLLKKTRLCIEPKIKGSSIAIQYIEGKLFKAISKKGIDVTVKIKELRNIPKNIPIKQDFQVRGELYVSNQTSELSRIIVNKYLLGEKVIDNKILFCCFQIINGKINQYETLNFLKKCGFSSPNYYTTNFISQVEFYRKEWLKDRIFSNYPNDGIVIKINSRKLQLIREKSFLSLKDWQYAIQK